MRDHGIHQFIRSECTLHHADPGAMDEYGDHPVGTVTTTTERSHWTQSTAGETDEIEHERWQVYFLPTVAIDANDVISYRGDDYQVFGNPWVVVDPVTGYDTHIEATVVRRI